MLSRHGLLNALEHVRYHATTPIAIDASGLGRHPAELEAAVYYCCLVEPSRTRPSTAAPGYMSPSALREPDNQLTFEVTDDGPGFDPSDAHGGMGLQNMRDRVGALDGHVSIATAIRDGTTVSGSIPLSPDQDPGNAHVGGGAPDHRDRQHAHA